MKKILFLLALIPAIAFGDVNAVKQDSTTHAVQTPITMTGTNTLTVAGTFTLTSTSTMNGAPGAQITLDSPQFTGAWGATGIYSNGSNLFLSGDLYDQATNSFETLFDGSGGSVLYAQKSAQTFGAFFVDQGYSTDGTTTDFLFTDGSAYNLGIGTTTIGTALSGVDGSPNGSSGNLLMTNGDASALVGDATGLTVGGALGSQVAISPNNFVAEGNFIIVSGGAFSDSGLSYTFLGGMGDGSYGSGEVYAAAHDPFGDSLSSLFDGSGGYVDTANVALSSAADGQALHGTDGSQSGFAAFQSGSGSLIQGAIAGTSTISSGVDFVTVSGLGLSYTPSFIIVTMRKATGGLNLFAIVRGDSISTDGFTADFNAATDSTSYHLDYLIVR